MLGSLQGPPSPGTLALPGLFTTEQFRFLGVRYSQLHHLSSQHSVLSFLPQAAPGIHGWPCTTCCGSAPTPCSFLQGLLPEDFAEC